jgi:Gluconate 2-dehydrogenase subunit 3
MKHKKEAYEAKPAMKQISRRLAVQTLALTPAVAALGAVQVHATEHVPSGPNRSEANGPKVFGPRQYSTLGSLCNSIIPPDETSGGALEAGVPELIDLLASENEDYRIRLMGGIQWLDAACQERYGRDYLDSLPDQKDEILNLIAYRESATHSPNLSSGIAFFTFLRDLTLGAYFTSEIGMKSLPYLGNQFVQVFPGCPPIRDS